MSDFDRVRLHSASAAAELLAAEGGCVSSDALASMINVSADQVVTYGYAKKVLAVQCGGRTVYPRWQAWNGRLLAGLDLIVPALIERTSDIGAIIFFLTPAESLDGKRPLDRLRDGDVASVVSRVKTYGQQGE